jgi:Cd2+/Zn2+-exporting ATPase
MGDDLSLLPFAIGLSRGAKRVIVQKLIISLAVIALLLITTTTGIFRTSPAVILHEGSTLVVLLNSLRLLAYLGRAIPRSGNHL